MLETTQDKTVILFPKTELQLRDEDERQNVCKVRDEEDLHQMKLKEFTEREAAERRAKVAAIRIAVVLAMLVVGLLLALAALIEFTRTRNRYY